MISRQSTTNDEPNIARAALDGWATVARVGTGISVHAVFDGERMTLCNRPPSAVLAVAFNSATGALVPTCGTCSATWRRIARGAE